MVTWRSLHGKGNAARHSWFVGLSCLSRRGVNDVPSQLLVHEVDAPHWSVIAVGNVDDQNIPGANYSSYSWVMVFFARFDGVPRWLQGTIQSMRHPLFQATFSEPVHVQGVVDTKEAAPGACCVDLISAVRALMARLTH